MSIDLTIDSICVTNTITSDGYGLVDKIYYLGENELKVKPQSIIRTSLSVEKCPLTFSYYVKNTATHEWELQTSRSVPFTTFDTLTGDLSIFTSDRALARIYSIKFRTEIPKVFHGNSFVEETFDLTVIHYCHSNKITASGSGLAA